jgi:hypothetical protein
MRRDPPVRRDGRCAQCKGERATPKGRAYARTGEIERDPFCSTQCCKAYHGVKLSSPESNRKRGPGRPYGKAAII